MLRRPTVLCAFAALFLGLIWLFYIEIFSFESPPENVEENTLSLPDVRLDAVSRERSSTELDRLDLVDSNNVEINLEQFRGLRKGELMKKLIETNSVTTEVLIGLVENGFIDINEILRDDHPQGSDHYTPLYAALVAGTSTEEQLELFLDYGAHIDPSLEAWHYIISKQEGPTADLLIRNAYYDHKQIWRIAELAYDFGNMDLFTHLLTDDVLPAEKIDSLIELTLADVKRNQALGAPSSQTLNQIQHLKALTLLNSEQYLMLLSLEEQIIQEHKRE
ncbi:hypothetical protein CWE13_05400 [Aliidiomarina shirensis]|uniref:Ankyrin repeat domain-containing protein n=1 Tax=Aliidiomarina shirensis TaxID=1048642 RepID=A0A432WUF1_9GAMM|nr:hypothetical protein [Aliidiomarina shirensis]RUO37396.1 hypothetical protein CWE13_05400 [Aliidiomarina shirensis]